MPDQPLDYESRGKKPYDGAEITTTKCSKCGSAMESGTMGQKAHLGNDLPNYWYFFGGHFVQGTIFKRFVKSNEKPILVRRCLSCGLIEFYAPNVET